MSKFENEFVMSYEQMCNGLFYDTEKVEVITFDASVKDVDRPVFSQFPNLRIIKCPKTVKYFDLEGAIEGCQNLKSILFSEEGYNHNLYLAGDYIPSSVRQSLSFRGWYEIVKYKPKFYDIIPSNMFDDKAFFENSVDAVIVGMTERARKITRREVEDRKKRDIEVFKVVKAKIEKERKARKPVVDEMKELYSSLKEEVLQEK